MEPHLGHAGRNQSRQHDQSENVLDPSSSHILKVTEVFDNLLRECTRGALTCAVKYNDTHRVIAQKVEGGRLPDCQKEKKE